MTAAAAPKVCTVDGCEKVVLARGLCSTHYKQWHRKGSPVRTRSVNAGVTCSVEGCFRQAVTKGMCKMHDKRLRRTGEAGPAQALRVRSEHRCFCGLPAVAGDLCRDHANTPA